MPVRLCTTAPRLLKVCDSPQLDVSMSALINVKDCCASVVKCDLTTMKNQQLLNWENVL